MEKWDLQPQRNMENLLAEEAIQELNRKTGQKVQRNKQVKPQKVTEVGSMDTFGAIARYIRNFYGSVFETCFSVVPKAFLRFFATIC